MIWIIGSYLKGHIFITQIHKPLTVRGGLLTCSNHPNPPPGYGPEWFVPTHHVMRYKNRTKIRVKICKRNTFSTLLYIQHFDLWSVTDSYFGPHVSPCLFHPSREQVLKKTCTFPFQAADERFSVPNIPSARKHCACHASWCEMMGGLCSPAPPSGGYLSDANEGETTLHLLLTWPYPFRQIRAKPWT